MKIIASCRKRLGKPKTYTGNFVPPQQETGTILFTPTSQTQQMPIASPMQSQLNNLPTSNWTPSATQTPPNPLMSGAPKPTFTMEPPKPKKPKNKKGFQSEIKNLLKSDKDNAITIEKKN